LAAIVPKSEGVAKLLSRSAALLEAEGRSNPARALISADFVPAHPFSFCHSLLSSSIPGIKRHIVRSGLGERPGT
jgi:hypothetical protein